MLRSRLSLPTCPFCTCSPVRPQTATQWQQTRSIARLQKRKPSRMELSSRVSENPFRLSPRQTPAPPEPRRPPPRTSGGFEHLNRTKPPVFPPARNGRRRDENEESEPMRPTPVHNPFKRDGDRHRSYVEPFKALKMQRALDVMPYGERASIKNRIADINTFDQFELLPELRDAIVPELFPERPDAVPSPVQRVAIPALLGIDQKAKKPKAKKGARLAVEKDDDYKMEQFLIAAETGSGKTLAYLLPAIDAMKRAEAVEREQAQRDAEAKKQLEAEKSKKGIYELDPPPLSSSVHDTARPKVIVLVPTSELVDQVGAVAKSLSHVVKFRTALISSAYTPTVIRNRIFSDKGIDMIISTPHLLASIAEESPNILSRVSHLIIDEADSLLDTSFSPLTSSVIERSAPSLRQLILCSATITRKLELYVAKRFPKMNRLVTPNLHAIPRRVQLGVMNVTHEPYRGKKDVACADAIWQIGRSALEHDTAYTTDSVDTKRIIVFVNEREQATELAEFLCTKGIDATALNRDSQARTADILAPFRAATRDSTPAHASGMKPKSNFVPSNVKAEASRGKLANTKVLVCTDLGSRGIDTLACRHVILYDVPHTSVDFIHRIGRLGRMGRRGRAIVLLGKGDRADVVSEVREAMYTGKALI
ncbi:P-loop containing nucleoside triphosphate hydrolase protein [Pseudovirgaria hyperparasitica]|uniref:RNA helicase n=1 Tax=Pseudovirgaria hyperparasitica TaxID=470096 RepID=A0A6A6WMC6_9PEZI|nr:P-loop containing nucleoside triphosphate hydrolase protein [Pseudovirgaria hyperparasitica]KAF2763303.1 P-loop containing nucleoside triphosphate hydrolase protein [Pseudovirgaria hyperparasitica]